ncbi:MAG: YidB family protein [Pseudolabrys sp.]
MTFPDQMSPSLKSTFSPAIVANAPELIAAVLAKTGFGNLQGLLSRLEQGGLHEQVASWLGGGANMVVTPAQIHDALGNEQVRQIAEHFGIPVDAALNLLAEHLPGAVDRASPDGVLHES